MRQGNGSDLLGLKDPRSTMIGIIYVASNDDRKSVLAAILTQEKLGREQIAIVLPENQPSKAFQYLQDFDDLRTIRRKLRARLIFIVPAGPGPGEFARQRRFSVYSSLESYTEALRAESLFAGTCNKQKKDLPFGFGRKTASLGGGAAVIALSNKKGRSVSMASLPSNKSTENAPNHTTSSYVDLSNPNQDQQEPLSRKDDGLVLSESDQVSSVPVVDGNDAIDQMDVTDRPTVASDAIADIVVTDLVSKSIQQPITPDVFAVASMGDDWDALPPASSTSSPQKDVFVVSSALNARPSLPPSSMPKTPDSAGGAEPSIIELSPLPRTVSSRSTVKLPAVGENTATSTVPSSEPPVSHTLSKSNNTGKAEVTTGALAAALPSRAVSVSRSPVRSSGKATQTEARRKKRGLGGLIVALLIVALLLLCSGVANSVVGLQLFHFVGNSAPATIAITPDSKLEQDSYVIQAVTGNANSTKRQISLRQLTFSPKEQSKLVTATGVGHVPAQAATGQLTFYNGSVQDFWVSSSIAIPGPNGISVVPDVPVKVPASNPPNAFGSASVSAHVTTPGSSGNMPAGTISGACCAASGSITVSSGAFTGGQDEKDYTFLQQSDVDGYVDQIKLTLSQQALSGVKGQLKPNEQLAGDPECTTPSREDQPIGDQGHDVTSANVTVNATCTGLAYDARGAQTLAQNFLQRKAISDLGQAYALVGTMVTKSTVTDVKDGVVTLQVTVSGTWSYQFNDKQKQMLVNQLANKTRVAAQDFLNSFKGISKAKISIADSGDSLPDDPGQIRIVVLAASGVSPANLSAGTN